MGFTDSYLGSVHRIISKCSELTEINLGNTNLSEYSLKALTNMIRPKIKKLSLSCQKFVNDKQIETLVTRCNKLTALDLRVTNIGIDSLNSITKHLKHTLEELDVSHTNIRNKQLHMLKSLPNLRVLNCRHIDFVKIERLQNELPHVKINQQWFLKIANSIYLFTQLEFYKCMNVEAAFTIQVYLI